MKKTWESWKKPPNFRPDFGSFVPNLGPKRFFRGFYLYLMLEIFASYHCMIFQGKLMTQTHFVPDLGLLGPNSCWKKNFFFKNLFWSVTRYHGQLSSCQISKKKLWSNLEKTMSDRWMDRRIDENDFIGCCLANVEWPIKKQVKLDEPTITWNNHNELMLHKVNQMKIGLDSTLREEKG